MMEIWKDIKGYEGLYQISNLGRIKSFLRFNGHKYINREKILKWQNNNYPTVRLANNGQIKQYLVHRLVAETFIPNYENKPCVNHKNGNKKDNRADNLEWVTHKENTVHAYNHNLIKKTSIKKKTTILENVKKAWAANKKAVNQYDLDGNFLKQWNSMSEASSFLKVTVTGISDCCRGKWRTSGGYIWKYENSDTKDTTNDK